MTEKLKSNDVVREEILKDPEQVLEDHDIMRALISADEQARGKNVVDLRTIALERLEGRLDRLEDTHRHVIAAAYDNLASTNQIHRAILAILEPHSFSEFLDLLKDDLATILNVTSVRLVLESPAVTPDIEDQLREEFGDGVKFCARGAVVDYINQGRSTSPRPVTFLGQGNLPGLLVLGSDDMEQFAPNKGSDLLIFFASAFERILRRWIS